MSDRHSLEYFMNFHTNLITSSSKGTQVQDLIPGAHDFLINSFLAYRHKQAVWLTNKCRRVTMLRHTLSYWYSYRIALNFWGGKLSWFSWLQMKSWKFLSQIFSHTRQGWITDGIIMKYSRFHKSFITKYSFWNRIQEITKVWSYMLGNYKKKTFLLVVKH